MAIHQNSFTTVNKSNQNEILFVGLAYLKHSYHWLELSIKLSNLETCENENSSKSVWDVISRAVDQNSGMSKKEDNNMDCKHRRMDCTIAFTRHKGITNY